MHSLRGVWPPFGALHVVSIVRGMHDYNVSSSSSRSDNPRLLRGQGGALRVHHREVSKPSLTARPRRDDPFVLSLSNYNVKAKASITPRKH